MPNTIPTRANEAHVAFAKQFGVLAEIGEGLAVIYDRILHANGYPTENLRLNAKQKRSQLHQATTNPHFGKNWFESRVHKSFKRTAHRVKRNIEMDAKLSQALRVRRDRLIPLWNFLDDLGNEHAEVIANLPGAKFYQTQEWRRFRYLALIAFTSRCMLCGASAHAGAQIEIDHIKPRYLYPEFAFHPENIQALCVDCHAAKGMSSDRHVTFSGKGVAQ